MIKHHLTWFGKKDGESLGEKELLCVSDLELKKLGLSDSTYSIQQVTELEQFSYLFQLVNFRSWTDEYDYFVERLNED